MHDLWSLPWHADGLNDGYESWALHDLLSLLRSGEEFNLELIRQTIDASWFVDGLQKDPLNHAEAAAIRKLSKIALEHRDLSAAVAGFAWAFDDDMTRTESDTIWSAIEMEMLVEGTGLWLAELPWMVDGITKHDKDAAFRLWDIEKMAVELDRDFFSLLDLVVEVEHDRIRLLDRFVMDTLYRLYEVGSGLSSDQQMKRAELFREVVNAPWFNDGLDDEERVRIISFWYDDLLGPYSVQSKAIDLPLAGEVNLWIVQHEPIPGYEDLLRFAEEAVRGTERLMGVPFPTFEVIVAIVRRQGDLGSRCYAGVAYNDRVDVGDWVGGGTALRRTVYHEIAHYYFDNGIGPGWILEGGADFAAWRIEDWLGYSSPEDTRVHWAEGVRTSCVEQGMTNLHMLATHEYSDKNAKLAFSCQYSMGWNFLLSLHEVMGDEALSAALGELYRTIELRFVPGFDWTKSDPEVYEIILKHTPTDKVEEVKDIYRWKHGGPFIDAED